MLKKISCAILAVSLAAPVTAELCTIDAVPAATLLLPYFEVNLKKRNKAEETLFSINNASQTDTIAHVTLWTDLSIPTLAFDVFLTGFDVQEISLLDLFFNGRLPEAVDNIVGLTDLEELRAAHSGRAVDGECYAQALAGSVARGYITIDNAVNGGLVFPNDEGYFTDNGASDENVLWGEYYVFSKKYIQQDRLVSIEAGDRTGVTFYDRFTQTEDQREPLGTTWGARYFSRTHLIVWRDSLANSAPFPCGEPEASGAYPLDQLEIIVFDDQEDATELTDAMPFPAQTQSVEVGSRDLPTFGYLQGWIYLNLNQPPDLIAQSFVTVRQDTRQKRRSRAMAMYFTNACTGSTNGMARTGRGGRR